MKQYQCITKLPDLQAYLSGYSAVAFDFETAPDAPWRGDPKAALDPHKAHIAGISFSVSEGTAVYVPLAHLVGKNFGKQDELWAYLRTELFENPEVVKAAHNLAFEAQFLYAKGIVVQTPCYDTIAAAQMTLKSKWEFRSLRDCGLKLLAAQLFGADMPSFETVTAGKHFDEMDPQQQDALRYACADSDYTLRLYHKFNGWFDRFLPQHRMIVEKLESPTAVYCGLMKYNGVPVDQGLMFQRQREAEEKITAIRAEIDSLTGGVDIGASASTYAFKSYLFRELKLPVMRVTAKNRTAADDAAMQMLKEWCAECRPELVRLFDLVQEYRKWGKLKSTYIDGYLAYVNAATGRIHPDLLPLGTETGRFAARAPNLQNCPRKTNDPIGIRNFIKADEGSVLMSLDFSQIELRVGAFYCRDEKMLDTYRGGGDIHAQTTSVIFNVPFDVAADKNDPDYMFAKDDGVVGVDIDHCYNPESGEFNPVAAAILAKQPTYAEFSPSGDGVHLFFKGTKPSGSSKNTETGVEMYDSARYFTVTGRQLPGVPDSVADGTDALAWIYEQYIKKARKKKAPKQKKSTTTNLTDEELLEKARSAEDGESFAALFTGDWRGAFPSQSEADMAFCRKLAFWSGKDREQMDRIFRTSGLYRPKWDEKHHADGSTYGEETLSKAIEAAEGVFSPGGEEPIFEKDGRYFRTKGDRVYPITNFLFKPVEMIISEDETQLTADLVTVRGETYRLTFMTSDFANLQKFKNLLNRNTIALSYLGSDGDLELLKVYVSELDWVRKTGVKAMGIYDHGGRLVFVGKDGAIERGGIAVEDIVQLEKYQSVCSGVISCDPLSKEKLPALGKWLMGYNEPAKVVSILAWAAGCFVKEHLRMEGVKFPHLFLIGEAGSGKSTTLERVLLPIFSSSRVTAASQVTAFTLMKDAASSNVIPMPLDEFKPSKMDRVKLSTLYNHFRDAYDGHAGVRGRSDLSVVTYDLAAPLIVAGEESADEAAIRERSVELLFSKKDLKSAAHRAAFNCILCGEQELNDLGRTLLNTALAVRPAEVIKWCGEGRTKFHPDLPSRIVSNLACCYAGLKLLEAVCAEYGFSWDAVFPYKLDSCAKYLEFAARDYLLDGGTNNQSIVEQTFEVMARMKLDPKVYYKIEDGQMYLWLPAVYDLYTKYRKDYAVTGEVLAYAQFKKQLTHSEYYIQSNVQRRIGTENRKCWIIDYAALRRRCDVSGFELTEIEPLNS